MDDRNQRPLAKIMADLAQLNEHQDATPLFQEAFEAAARENKPFDMTRLSGKTFRSGGTVKDSKHG